MAAGMHPPGVRRRIRDTRPLAHGQCVHVGAHCRGMGRPQVKVAADGRAAGGEHRDPHPTSAVCSALACPRGHGLQLACHVGDRLWQVEVKLGNLVQVATKSSQPLQLCSCPAWCSARLVPGVVCLAHPVSPIARTCYASYSRRFRLSYGAASQVAVSWAEPMSDVFQSCCGICEDASCHTPCLG